MLWDVRTIHALGSGNELPLPDLVSRPGHASSRAVYPSSFTQNLGQARKFEFSGEVDSGWR